MEKKYELTNESIKWRGRTLYRIKAIKDFSDVKKGDLGGWIEKDENLSHEMDCWVYNNAKVYDDAKILYCAIVNGNAEVFGKAVLTECSCASDNSTICGSIRLYDDIVVCGDAIVSGNFEIFGDAKIY